MKANELMIGDWVKSPYSFDKVETIFGDAQRVFLSNSCYLAIDELEPIPITAEILEKNGFEWNEYHNMLNIVCGSTHIGWGLYKSCLSISDWGISGDSQISSIRCECVHQLQHALRLCGIEKEIEL